ncbi:putative death-receptor fusion protein-domain-containing protein [Nemania diffusa]|nr:putative death-receptor fusion protein-domain-containing protein [Nemania diffusa]
MSEPDERTSFIMGLNELPEIRGTSFNQKAAVSWLEKQSEDLQFPLAEHVFEELLSNASQPKQSSGNACSKLCGFVEICSKSASPALKSFAFAHATSMKMFNFFIEWNEQDAHRSIRLILDYIVSSIIWNPDANISKSIKGAILDDTISVITLQASKPSTKSSMIAIDHFLQKKVVYLSEVLHVYQQLRKDNCGQEAMWDSFISQVFAWMELQYVWTVAGKLLVTILTHPWYQDDKISKHHPSAWHRFILSGLKTNFELLEPIKVYVFIPLFRTDPTSTLVYLNELASLQKLTANESGGWDLNAMLWVALLEAGKKTGVVGEPNHASKNSMEVAGQLPTHILDVLLSHESHEARASGLSILIASPSTTKPYALETLRLLQKHLPSFYEDVDPKIRYDVLGYSRNMIRRLHNSVDALRKESVRASKNSKNEALASANPNAILKSKKISQDGRQPATNENTVKSTIDIIREHEEFIEWYTSFLKKELVPTASYQRHITSLKAMHYFLKSSLIQGDETSVKTWPASLLVDNMWFRSVLDLIMDPYDDVRETAVSLIILLQSGGSMAGPPAHINSLASTPLKELQMFCRKANDLALKTARADHCDGAARSQELLFRWSSNLEEAAKVLDDVFSNLERKLCAVERDLAAAVLHAPVHGDFASLRYIWSSLTGIKIEESFLITLDEFQDRAISCCLRVWRTVQHILCDDSPEGHLPEELQQIEGLDTKDLLSYSFRAIHESSNLMRTIAQNARYDRKQGFLAPSQQNFEEIGNLTFDELSNLRHRGAFSTVSQTFTACCQLIQYIPAPQRDTNLVKKWYEGALNCIYTQGSTTRRSAGIPAIIVGILASKADNPSFKDVIIKLQEIGRQPAFVSETDGSNLAQVHALNCLKDVFKTSFLSPRAEPYLTDCLQLAALSLQSEVWAIRNCGLLLLRSLIDNLFGTTENKTAMEAGWDGRTVRISYHKFEALPSLLVNLLELGKKTSSIVMGTQTAEAVFPALDIIRRAGPPEGHLAKLYEIISWYLGSHIWHVREIAARTLCSLLLRSTWLQSIKMLIISPDQSSNKLHGALLTTRFLLERLLQVMPEQLSEENINAVYEILSDLSTSNNCLSACAEAQAVYIDILNFMAKSTQTQPNCLLRESRMIRAQQDSSQEPLALLNLRTSEMVVQQILQGTDEKAIDMLGPELEAALATDINVACGMVAAISRSSLSHTAMAQSRLASTYMHICFATKSPEPRTVALEALASLIDVMLGSASEDSTLSFVPPEDTMLALWSDLHRKPINSSLSDAIIRASGPLVAISLVRAQGKVDERLAQQLMSWGAMMSDARMADRTFDTRIAAIEAINSLSSIVRFPHDSPSKIHQSHLPWLLALYDVLTDDDVEVREAAARAAKPILGLAFVPAEAGVRLLRWLTARFGHEPDFLMHVGGRMVGHNFGSTCFITTYDIGGILAKENGLNWVSAKTQLADAMRFDDSLFVIEEHNQYIDEVREAKRWTDVFLSVNSSTVTNSRNIINKALAEWTLAGLRALTGISQSESTEGGDGPLGWTSKPEVFAICARILICASTLARLKNTHGQEHDKEGEGENAEKEAVVYKDLSEELSRFWKLGHDDQTRVHGLLLEMCGIEE